MKKSAISYFFMIMISLGIGLNRFFGCPWLVIDLNSNSYIWFLNFSQTIFQPQSNYYAESILLPLVAKIFGFSQALKNYKLLCALFTIAILPLCSVYAFNYFQSFIKALLATVLFAISFEYLQYYILGFPDPLTILLIISVVFLRNYVAVFICMVLALLSHFSMAVISIFLLTGMIYLSPAKKSTNRNTFVGLAVGAIILGKLFLITWYAIFQYKLVSRVDWVLSKGYSFFLNQYLQNLKVFWLTPGVIFLLFYAIILSYLITKRKYLFVLWSITCLVIAYIALFLTVDGLRVFSVIMAAPYFYLLVTFIQVLSLDQELNRFDVKHLFCLMKRPGL